MSTGPLRPLDELTREELIERIEEQERQLSVLQSQVDSLRELVERTAQAQAEHERDDRAEAEKTLERFDKADRQLARTNGRVADVEEELEERATIDRVDRMFDTLRSEVDAISTADAYEQINGVPEPELSWIERYEHIGPEAISGTIHKREVHARILYRKLTDWGFKDNYGNVILRTDGLLAKINRQWPEFEHSQMYRAMKTLADRSDGKIEYRKNSRLGHHLRIKKEKLNEVALDFGGMSGPPGRSGGR